MPHIRIRALAKDLVQKLSVSLPRELAPLMKTTEDNFTIEHVQTDFFSDGSSVAGDPLIEVSWFERGQLIQDQSAALITAHVAKLSNSTSICVSFTALPQNAYYENGKHF